MKIQWKYQKEEQSSVGLLEAGETFLLNNKPYIVTNDNPSSQSMHCTRLDTGTLVRLEKTRMVCPTVFLCSEQER